MTRTLFTWVVLLTLLTLPVITKNASYYIVSIQKSAKDPDYDQATAKVQSALDELVNQRMNDIYTLISDYRQTYDTKDPLLDELDKTLKALNPTTSQTKTKTKTPSKSKKYLQFINRNRPNDHANTDDANAIPLESKLVSHICPVLNYYTVRAYLSEPLVVMVQQLPHVIYCEESMRLEQPSFKVNEEGESRRRRKRSSSSTPYYNLDAIQKETNWTAVKVQPDANLHLSLLSQSTYHGDLVNDYDDNYYYPATAGKGIDLYFIDDGLYTSHEDFDTYAGHSYERTVTCDAIVKDGITRKTDHTTRKKCSLGSDLPEHGSMVASVAGGAFYGVAKHANLHMIATDFTDYDFAAALDYIKEHARPYRTLINISRGGAAVYHQTLQEKINELTNAGFIIFASSGNEGQDACYNRDLQKKSGQSYQIHAYVGYQHVIGVGATYNDIFSAEDTYKAHPESNYGSCVDLHAPYYVVSASFSDCRRSSGICTGDAHVQGTSFSSPLVMGVAALVMAEHPELRYTYAFLRKTLIDMAVPNAITSLKSKATPNRFLNNGKKIVYSPDQKYHGCGVLAGHRTCPSKGCCAPTGDCIDPATATSSSKKGQYCRVEKGCQSEFGVCWAGPTNVKPVHRYGLTEGTLAQAISLTSGFPFALLYQAPEEKKK